MCVNDAGAPSSSPRESRSWSNVKTAEVRVHDGGPGLDAHVAREAPLARRVELDAGGDRVVGGDVEIALSDPRRLHLEEVGLRVEGQGPGLEH